MSRYSVRVYKKKKKFGETSDKFGWERKNLYRMSNNDVQLSYTVDRVNGNSRVPFAR